MRIRTIKPEFWTNEKMSALPDFTKLVALGLLNYADDHGYFWANPLMIRGALFPFQEDSKKLLGSLSQLAAEGYLRLGKTEDGRDVGQIVKFNKHQRVDKPRDSEIQPLAIFVDQSKNLPGIIQDESPLYRIGKEGIGKEGIHSAKPSVVAGERKRNPNFDALAAACGIDPLQMTSRDARACGVALAEILKVSPSINLDEFSTRAANYRTHYRGAALTPSALCAHWAACAKPNGVSHAQNQRPNDRRLEATDAAIADLEAFRASGVVPYFERPRAESKASG